MSLSGGVTNFIKAKMDAAFSISQLAGSSQPSLGSALAQPLSKGFPLLVRLSVVLNELKP